MARSMLSVGTEKSRAFCTAEASVMLPSMLGPPSRADTSMARRSLANTRARFSSFAPFLRLMELHLECPDMAGEMVPERSAGQFEEPPVQSGVAGDLRMERRRQAVALPDHDRDAPALGRHCHASTGPPDPPRAAGHSAPPPDRS